jgi:hypothetical protein
MTASAKHPHIDNPAEEQLAGLLEGKPPALRELYLALHRLILATLPDVQYRSDCTDGMTSYGMRQYGYDGWGMAALAAHARWVSLHFMHGVLLPDEAGVLEGSGKQLRHVKLRSAENLATHRDAIITLLRAAHTLNA